MEDCPTQKVFNDLLRTRLSLRRMFWFLAHPSPSPVSKLSIFLSLPVCRRLSLLTGEGGRGVCGAKSYGREKAWSSISHSILSDPTRIYTLQLAYARMFNDDISVLLRYLLHGSVEGQNKGYITVPACWDREEWVNRMEEGGQPW